MQRRYRLLRLRRSQFNSIEPSQLAEFPVFHPVALRIIQLIATLNIIADFHALRRQSLKHCCPRMTALFDISSMDQALSRIQRCSLGPENVLAGEDHPSYCAYDTLPEQNSEQESR